MEVQVLNRKSQIRQTACLLFREKGYAGTSMRDLAKHIGIEPASLYSHIKSKENILQDICFGMAKDFFSAFNDVLIENDTPEIKLKKAIEGHIKVILNNADASAVFFYDWRYLSAENLTKFKAMRRKYEKGFENILEEGVDLGSFKEINIRFTIQSLFSCINWLYDWKKVAMFADAEEMSTNFTNIFFNGILNENNFLTKN
ncbi:MAG: TetR/AcrR family transcriptional regulator [Chitinophagaceae bacterium]|nr:MAG: TetR/AcrR family transcriptional regulator [Chitinophagaceae bacterium]